MPTGQVLLPIPGGIPSATPCGQKTVTSSSVPTNGVAARHTRLQFDQSTDETWLWVIVVPADYVSGGSVHIKHGADVTSGNVIWKASLCPVIDGSDDTDGVATNTVQTSSATAVPGTSGYLGDLTITPDATDMAAGRLCVIMVGRDADNGSDTAAGDAWIAGAVFEYTR